MITDDLFTRYKDGTLDAYLNVVTDLTLLNNYKEELIGFANSYKLRLIQDPNNESCKVAITNISIVIKKIEDRVAFMARNIKW